QRRARRNVQCSGVGCRGSRTRSTRGASQPRDDLVARCGPLKYAPRARFAAGRRCAGAKAREADMTATRKGDRRQFLRGVAVGGAAGRVPPDAPARPAPAVAPSEPPRAALRPSAAVAAAETAPPQQLPHLPGRPGSDFMVDVIKSLDIDYVASNPASS